MIDKKELISTYLQQFGSHYQISRLLNPTLRIDDEFISHFFEQVVDQYGETFAITEEEKTEIERKIKSQYCIFQDEGAALVGDYEHDFMWYANLQAQEDYDEYYWPRYKAHLENKNFSPAGIDTLENKTLPKLMSYIGNPNEDSPFSIRGLVVGDVQSGKTSNYLGLITKAADAGYKVIFLLTGTIESLRRQTQKRVEEGFIGYDSVNAEDVGVGRGSHTPKAFTSRDNDFTGKNDQNTTYRINDNASEPMIFVIKKNVSVLKKLYASLKNINTSSAVSQIAAPMIMIDDEADNASINTNKKDEDPTKINNYIRKILTLFARNTYVGFTATPFANVFISYDTQDEMLADDLFPRHFIYSLESPSNYCGAQKYFFESNSNVRFINDYDDKVFPLRHKKEWDGDKLFPSFYHSINVFLLANAIRDIREVEKNTHRSMLINMSRFTDVQFVIKEIAENYFADKGDFIYRECGEDGTEFISIMFEMKNEADTTATKHKNEDFFKELDKDRKEKACEYAILVSLLEVDNELYNNGIVDVSYKYPKMYVIRPQFFIPIITLLRNAAQNSLHYRQELQMVRNQQVDILHFEDNMNAFKEGFARNYRLASEKFTAAIEEIDKTIDHLQKTKAALLSSENNLRLANNKADELSIKRLTKNAPTVKAMFDDLHRDD